MKNTKIWLVTTVGFFLFLGAHVCAAQQAPSSGDDKLQLVKAELDAYDKYAPDRAAKGHASAASVVAPPSNEFFSKVKITGEVRMAMGFDRDNGVFFTRANSNLNEKNFRILSSDQLNNRQNTFDPAVYSRIKVVVDAMIRDSVGMHMNVTVDPWSYTGKSKEVTVTSAWGDKASYQYLFWGNNGYTMNHSVNTQRYGGTLNLPEVKVKGNTAAGTSVNSTICNQSNQCDSFSLPELKIDYTFQPLRELWFDFKPGDNSKIRIFPMAYQDQAMTTDEPLRLSNNRTWWEESPWIDDWRPGQVNVGNTPVDFTKGWWDKDLAFATSDSDVQRLTALRGVSIDMTPAEDTTLQATLATPKTLWQEYSEVTAVPGSARLKHFVGDNMYVGGTTTMHLGLINGKIDKQNYVGGVDTGIVLAEHVKLSAQVSTSVSENDITNDQYRTKDGGQAYYASLEAVSNAVDFLKTDYLGQKAGKGDSSFYKTKLYFGRMDRGFESSLSNYHQTRKDAFWSRHLTFYPSPYSKMPGVTASMTEWDQGAFAIGTGLDYGRNAVGWRADMTQMDGKLDGMGDVRYVTTNENKYVETVARTEWKYLNTDKLTTKALLLWHGMPKTRAGEDPFVTSNELGTPFLNDKVAGGSDRDLKTATLGARYELTDWADVNGVWEYTNDFTLGADNYPNKIFDGMTTRIYTQNGNRYRENQPFLYDQGDFDQAPYAYHHIFKTGLHVQPTDIWDMYFDYTRNPNGFAGNIDDNMNHFGLETSLVPNARIGLYARYVISRGYDLNVLNRDKQFSYRTYHNVFLEGRYIAPKDNTFSLQYGVGPVYFVETSSTNPSLAFYAAPVLTTQHMIRLIYEKKF